MEILLGIILSIAFVIGILSLIRIPVLKGKLGTPIRLWYLLFCPPKDLFDSIGGVLMTPDELNQPHRFEFSAKYAGLYN